MAEVILLCHFLIWGKQENSNKYTDNLEKPSQMFLNLYETQWCLYLAIKTSLATLYLSESGFNTGQANVIFFFFLLWQRWMPAGLYITDRTYLKVLRYCLPHSCHLLLVEWMSSLLTPVWALHGLLMPKFSWHYNKHPNTSGILLPIELRDRTLFVSRSRMTVYKTLKGRLTFAGQAALKNTGGLN